MATLNIPNSFTAGTAAVASQVNANFTAVKSFVEAISSGTNIDAGAVTYAKLAADATNLFVPIGGLLPYAGAAAPNGGKWMLADGSAISRTSYSALFSVVGTTYGIGDGVTTFNLPNLKGRVVVGLDATQTEFDALSETGGVKSVTLTSAQSGLVGHSHSITDPGHAHNLKASLDTTYSAFDGQRSVIDGFAAPVGDWVQSNTTGITGTQSVASANAAEAHTNLQPYIVLNYIIRVV